MVKVSRSATPPPSLEIEREKQSGKYSLPDVISQLRTDFHGKCYLCEVDMLDVNVEHLRPHHNGKYPDRKFDWNNLFPCCPHCNHMKEPPEYEDKILDCCALDPEAYLHQVLYQEKVHVYPVKPDSASESVWATAKLITACFENKNTGIRLWESRKRYDLLSETMERLYQNLRRYLRKPSNRTLRILRGMLDRSAPFAGFARTYVRLHIQKFPDLAPYVSL